MLSTVQAIEINPTTFTPARFGTIGSLLSIVIPFLYITAVVLLLVMGIHGALTILQSGDDPEKIDKAKQTIQWAILGIVVIFISYLITKLFGIVFNIDVPL